MVRPRRWIAKLAASAALAVPIAATGQETRPLPENYSAPAAQIEEFSWLAGQWQGKGIGGNLALESWLSPTGDTMVGTFVQTNAEGNIQFTEHMYLLENEGSVTFRLKHFNPDMTSWEEREKYVTFRLLEVEHCAAYFAGLTLRCDGEDGLLVAVRMREKDGEISELIFLFRRAA